MYMLSHNIGTQRIDFTKLRFRPDFYFQIFDKFPHKNSIWMYMNLS
jgi:hypothetical protein